MQLMALMIMLFKMTFKRLFKRTSLQLTTCAWVTLFSGFAVAQPVNIDGYDLQVSCCVGVCVYPECATDAEELLKHAGSARDNAKNIGYGSYSFYTKDMRM